MTILDTCNYKGREEVDRCWNFEDKNSNPAWDELAPLGPSLPRGLSDKNAQNMVPWSGAPKLVSSDGGIACDIILTHDIKRFFSLCLCSYPEKSVNTVRNHPSQFLLRALH